MRNSLWLDLLNTRLTDLKTISKTRDGSECFCRKNMDNCIYHSLRVSHVKDEVGVKNLINFTPKTGNPIEMKITKKLENGK